LRILLAGELESGLDLAVQLIGRRFGYGRPAAKLLEPRR
jgi:hypothetical protein